MELATLIQPETPIPPSGHFAGSSRVSICLPCLNAINFLPECLDSILSQTDVAWELIACDGYSTDGSWDLIRDFCCGYPNRTCFQSSAPLYDAWNLCIQRATGAYIYIATSDDVLAPGSLQRMVDALELEPGMSICQIRLKVIDQDSVFLPVDQQWEHGRLSHFLPGFTSQANRRIAPHDGVLMAGFHTVYESINQLLIRRTVFDEVGLFDQRFGPAADFEWGMRVGLTQNCVYLPEPVAYWRKHAAQLTQPAFTPSERLHALAMTRSAFRRAALIRPALPAALLNDMEDVLYDDYLSALSPAALPLGARLCLLVQELSARPLLLFRRLIRSLHRRTTTTFDYARKRERLLGIMQRYCIARPVFSR